ncbi:hypothetical protein D9M73_233280 [compost metagenome]
MLPAPETEACKQQARHNAIGDQHPDQPSRPGLPGIFDGQCAVAAGADHALVRHAEAKQAGQGTQRLGHIHKGIGAEDGSFPDETVAAGRQQHQQHHQCADQGQ